VREIEKELSNHKISIEVAPGMPLVRMDFVLMQQVLANLLLNAAVHTPPGTVVQVKAGPQGNVLVLKVVDTGPGLPAEAMGMIFDKFYRGPSAPAGGTGLGLAIVKGFVEAQGGQVKAESCPGAGAAFTIQMPMAQAPPMVAEAVQESKS